MKRKVDIVSLLQRVSAGGKRYKNNIEIKTRNRVSTAYVAYVETTMGVPIIALEYRLLNSPYL